MNDKKVIEELNKLPLLKEIQNKTKPNIVKTYHVQFRPTSKVFSIVLLGEGACLVVDKFKLSYFYCEKASIKGVALPKSVSPASGNRTVNSNCFNNTIPPREGAVFGLCSSGGKWKFVTPCFCKKGSTFGSKGCVECQRNTYKANIGNDPCLPCPSNSESVPQAVRCDCKKGFHRYRYSEDKDVCYESPPKSKNNNNVLIIPLVVVSSLLLIIIILVIFRKKLDCCSRKTNLNEYNVSVAQPVSDDQLQQPDPVITVSADAEYLDLTDLDPEDDGTYEEPIEHPYEHPYMGLSSNREPRNQYQSLELTTDDVGQAS